jgi:alpha-methylacyl-CoA racemase
VTLAALEPRFFRAFCEAVDRPDLLESHLTRETAERAHLRSELESLFAGRTRAEWLDLLGEDTMVGPVNTPAEALVDPQFGERDVFTDTSAGHRRVRVPALSTGSGDPGAVPALGTYTDAVLAEHGFDTATVAELREDGIVH